MFQLGARPKHSIGLRGWGGRVVPPGGVLENYPHQVKGALGVGRHEPRRFSVVVFRKRV